MEIFKLLNEIFFFMIAKVEKIYYNYWHIFLMYYIIYMLILKQPSNMCL